MCVGTLCRTEEASAAERDVDGNLGNLRSDCMRVLNDANRSHFKSVSGLRKRVRQRLMASHRCAARRSMERAAAGIDSRRPG
jgi:hypothetical protein